MFRRLAVIPPATPWSIFCIIRFAFKELLRKEILLESGAYWERAATIFHEISLTCPLFASCVPLLHQFLERETQLLDARWLEMVVVHHSQTQPSYARWLESGNVKKPIQTQLLSARWLEVVACGAQKVDGAGGKWRT